MGFLFVAASQRRPAARKQATGCIGIEARASMFSYVICLGLAVSFMLVIWGPSIWCVGCLEASVKDVWTLGCGSWRFVLPGQFAQGTHTLRTKSPLNRFMVGSLVGYGIWLPFYGSIGPQAIRYINIEDSGATLSRDIEFYTGIRM